MCKWLCPGTSAASSLEGIALALQHEGKILTTAGIHPYEAGRASPEDWAIVTKCLENPYCVAVGECGIDGSDGFPSLDVQIPIFQRQVSMCDAGPGVFINARF